MFRTSARRWSDILLRKKRMPAGGRRDGPARGKRCRGISVQSSIALLSHYIETWASKCRGSPSPCHDRYSVRTRGTRVKISPVMHGKFGTVGSLCRGWSMQIRHEISLIVVCRMTEPGNRPFCGSGSDRPKTATRRGIGAAASTDAAPTKHFKAPFAS